MTDRYNVSKLIEVLCVRTLSNLSPISAKSPVIINTLHPGLARSTLLRDTYGLKATIFSILTYIIGKSTEEGSRTLVIGASADESTHGQYMSEGKIKQPAPFVLSEKGAKAQARVWEELIEKLEEIQPGITANIRA